MNDKPSQALRRGKGSSMWLALEAVEKGEAHAAVSAGNTGALMAMAKLILRPMTGIERPAIAALWPTITSECIVLDVGANIGASARQLADFALMGAAMARALFHVERPTVGLLNVGVEEIKGAEEVKEAHAMLKELDLPLDYRGFIEGDEIGQGKVDVVVVEGFAGNIALKTAEGTARQIGQYLKDAMIAHDGLATRRAARPRRLPRAEGEDGPAPRQWRHLPRPERYCGQEPRRHRCARLCERRRSRLRDGRERPLGAARRGSRCLPPQAEQGRAGLNRPAPSLADERALGPEKEPKRNTWQSFDRSFAASAPICRNG